MSDSLWYKDAVIYQLHVRSFFDSVGDGIGDFGGLTQKLDYLQDLGVTALWLMPFYPSPLRDDGYDIADYENINPQYGTLESFQQFLDAAHERDLKVITELVINHTSDQHPWFQRARRAPPGSPERDFYVWSDSPEKYRDARIIFKDFEPSNWTYDRLAKSYFWHRFYAHQPDLNYDNPAVRQAIVPLLDYWLAMGVDGLRLDAVPYLYEREGTNCENLPETHAYLKALRTHVDAKFPNRMLLAEANQWPEDAVAYFGEGDECHMAFHFPVMPRLFMSIHREDRFPIIDIMDQTPAIPANCQWAMFLRNHDELTLEMVTDEERDYMYRAYAAETQARINLGIRRRLAPLLSNNRRRIELMNGLLFSLPGTPVIYYGDEIGMGDNIYLGDRNGVRTPMQWSADRNAGFSRSNPQKLFLPIIIDPEYHYEALNVEAQQNNPHSLLWWMKRLIDARKRSRALTRGTLEFLYPKNRKVLAFLRKFEDDTVLVVANLSRFVQYVDLDLASHAGHLPIEVFGGTRFPLIGRTPLIFTLAPHSFLWFQLIPQLPEMPPLPAHAAAPQLPVLTAHESWLDVAHRDEDDLERALAAFLSRGAAQAGDRTVKAVRIMDSVRIPLGEWSHDRGGAQLVLLEADRRTGEVERHALPLLLATNNRAEEIAAQHPAAAIARTGGTPHGLLYEATLEPQLAASLLALIANQGKLKTRAGAEVAAWRAAELPGELPLPTHVKSRPANVSFNCGDRFLLKFYRQVEEGLHPEIEFGRFFNRWGRTVPVAKLLGAVELKARRAGPMALAVLHEYIQSAGDSWHYTQDALGDFFERVVTLDAAIQSPPPPDWRSGAPCDPRPPADLIADYLDVAQLLGRRTAELHLALAVDEEDPAFAPEPFSPFYQRSIYQTMRGHALQTLDELQQRLPTLAAADQPAAEHLLAQRSRIVQEFRQVLAERLETVRIRCHGDYHLGQILFTGKDFTVIDFEGNTAVPLTERRIKRSPLRDVASLIRSFDYAGRAALAQVHAPTGPTPGSLRPSDLPRVAPWTRYWTGCVTTAFWHAYRTQPGIEAFLPTNGQGTRMLLEMFLLERSLIDLGHELRDRPEWVSIALDSVLDLLQR